MLSSDYKEILTVKGIHPSVQRTAIYQFLSEHPIHPTAEKIYTSLSPDYPSLSRTTVYNTLKLFTAHNLVQVIRTDDDELRYDANIEPHLHFKCTCCGKLFDFFDDVKIEDYSIHCSGLLPKGFQLGIIQTTMWGLCPYCTEKQS